LADHSVSGAALVVTEKVSDILDHQKFWSVRQPVDESADVIEQPTVVIGALVLARLGYRLAGETEGQDGRDFQGDRVSGTEVPDVWYVRVADAEELTGLVVVV
jgi:hypothetical protein